MRERGGLAPTAGVTGAVDTLAATELGSNTLEVRDVARRFGKTHALAGVSLNVAEGTIHAVLGPNGAGKTTLIRIIVGLTDPDEGEVRLGGRTLGTPRTRTARRAVGMVPSGDRTLYLRLTGIENLVFFARLAGLRRGEAVRAAETQLARVGLADVGRDRVHTYSHGMQKRLAIARAFLTRPELLLFDEATHDIDPLGAEQIRALVREAAAGGTAVIWTTQRVEEVRGFCDRVTLLSRGSVRFHGSVGDLIAHGISHRFVLDVARWDDASLAAANAALPTGSLVPGTDGELVLSLSERTPLGEAIVALTSAGLTVTGCRQERSEVEDAFLALTEPRA